MSGIRFFLAVSPLRKMLFLVSVLFISSCDIELGGTGPVINTRAPVTVALLVPFGSDQANQDILATSLQNAAQLAISDLNGVEIELKVYKTAGNTEQAAAAAKRAVDEGAKIILGPVFADAANAAGAAVASRGVTVLSFSNNTEIAGGNIFVLGHTFENTADRLVSYAKSQGLSNILVIHANNLTGEVGRKSVQNAAAVSGSNFTGSASYEFSQRGVISAVRDIAKQVRDTDTQALVFASDTAGALPILAQLLPENGIDPKDIQFMGLTRWDIPTQTLSLGGLQGGWFALPDPSITGAFNDRYRNAFGQAPHPLAGIAYDGIAAIGALLASGNSDALSRANLTQNTGFAGVNGVFRLLPDGTNQRAMAVVAIEDRKVKVIDPAPRSFRGGGI